VKFSTGDIIACVIGGFALLRWLIDWIRKRGESQTTYMDSEEHKLGQLRTDFDVHKAEDAQQFTWIKDSLQRIERRVENLQSQMRFLSTGTNNQVFHTDKEGEGR